MTRTTIFKSADAQQLNRLAEAAHAGVLENSFSPVVVPSIVERYDANQVIDQVVLSWVQ